MTTPTDLEREVARAIAGEHVNRGERCVEPSDRQAWVGAYVEDYWMDFLPHARAARSACFMWRPIGPEQMDGEEWIVGFDSATVWITRAAYWDDGEGWQEQGFASQDAARGWWSYKHSVTQEKLDEHHTPTHYLCLTPPEPEDGK